MNSTDPGDVFHLVYTTEAGSNYARWSDPKVDDLAARALRESNRERRKQLYWELQRHILSDAPGAVAVGWVEGWFFRDKRVINYKPAKTAYDNNTFMKVSLRE